MLHIWNLVKGKWRQGPEQALYAKGERRSEYAAALSQAFIIQNM